MFYLAILDDGPQDFRSACGPFQHADKAALAEDMLLTVRPKAWSLGRPYELAQVGSHFVVCLGYVDGLNCVIGPYDSMKGAKKEIQDCLRLGGVFDPRDDYFIATVRFIRQDWHGNLQIAILERCGPDVAKRRRR